METGIERRCAVVSLLAAALIAAATVSALLAETAYPTKPVTIVVPHRSGAASDHAARALADAARGHIGPVRVVNRTGGGGTRGSALVWTAAPDGYTLLLARVGTHTVAPAMTSVPYAYRDFTYLGVLDTDPVTCATAAGSPDRSLSDLIEAVRRSPGRLRYSTPGPGTLPHIAPIHILAIDGIPNAKAAAVAVHVSNAAAAARAVIEGEADFVCASLSDLIDDVQEERLRALVVTTPERVPAVPDVPTARELGYPSLEVLVGWSALAGPPGMDRAAVETWQAALRAVEDDEDWRRRVGEIGAVAAVRDPKETMEFIDRQYWTFRELVDSLDLRVE